MKMKNYACNKCGSMDVFIKQNGGQTGLYCSDCGSWIKWVGKSELPMVERFIEEQKKDVPITYSTNTQVIAKYPQMQLDELFTNWSKNVNPYAFEEEIVERFIEWMKRR